MAPHPIPSLTLPLKERECLMPKGQTRFYVSNLGNWDLFEIWCLPVGRGFGAFIYSMLVFL
jgi:hypothetical protein